MAKVRTTLAEYSDEELQKELKRRVEERNKPPMPLKNPNFSKLITMLVSGVNNRARDKYTSEDFNQFAFEAAMEATFGKDIWQWWNEGYKHCHMNEG